MKANANRAIATSSIGCILSSDSPRSSVFGRRGVLMSNAGRVGLMAVSAIAVLLAAVEPFAQSGLPNPYRPVKGIADGGGPFIPGGDWARLPGGREMGPPASVHVVIDGGS